jgi:hypothetical protein
LRYTIFMNELEPNDPNRITYFAATHTRGKHVAFGIRARDRDKHMYVIGKSGMGKSTMLENMAIQDIQNDEGLCFIDPHGSTAEKLLEFVPEDRIKDVLYLAPFDVDNPVGFNIMEDVGYDQRHKVVSGLIGTFERIWADAWSARMQYILQNTLLALLEYPGSTIIDVNRMLVNKAFREDVIKKISDPVIESFWKEEFAGYTDRYTQEATPAIQNKIGQFISNPLIRNVVGQPVSSFDAREIMDKKKILIINLSKGRMGESNAALLGSMLVIKIYLAALSRAEEPPEVMRSLPPFYFYVDEFQSVVNEAFSNILSEARKYKLALIIAHQYIEQMEEEVRNAIFGNVGTTVMFRVGPIDAEFLKTVFEPTFYAEDMVNLGIGEIYLTLMIDGVGSQPFSAHTIPPIEEPNHSFREQIIDYTRRTYGRRRESVEEAIRLTNDKWHVAAQKKHKDASAGGQQRSQAPGGGKKFTPATRHEAPKTTRSPSEVLRERMPEIKKEVRSWQPHSKSNLQKLDHKNKEESTQKNALQDAIAAATHGKIPKPPQPKPKLQDQQKDSKQKQNQHRSQQHHRKDTSNFVNETKSQSQKHEQKPLDDGVSPEELMRILNGDD